MSESVSTMQDSELVKKIISMSPDEAIEWVLANQVWRTNYFLEIRKKYGKDYLLKTKNSNIFFAFSSESVKEIAIDKYSSFKKDGGFERLKEVLGNGLLTSEEPDHIKNKRTLYYGFSNQNINKYVENLYDITTDLIKSWNNSLINIQEQTALLVYNTITKIFFSVENNIFFKSIKNNLETITEKISTNTIDDEFYNSAKELKSICRQIVDERLKSKENKEDFLQNIIDAYNLQLITIDTLYDEAATVLFAGYETSSHSLSWAIYLISTNPSWANTIRQEYSGISKENFLINSQKLSFTGNFINETLRMYPPVWVSERVAIEDVKINGFDIKTGTKVILSSFVTHRDPDLFDDPEKFNPDRWILLEESKINTGSYFPFQIGKRMCVGKYFSKIQSQIVLGEICSRYKIDNFGNTPVGEEIMTYKFKKDISLFMAS